MSDPLTYVRTPNESSSEANATHTTRNPATYPITLSPKLKLDALGCRAKANLIQ